MSNSPDEEKQLSPKPTQNGRKGSVPTFVQSVRGGLIDLQPTQRKFTPAKWQAAFESSNSGDPADERLYHSGLYYHEQLQGALGSFLQLSPVGLPAQDHVRLLVAAANLVAAQDQAMLQRHLGEVAATAKSGGNFIHGATMVEAAAALAARTVQLIDGLRHILPEAAKGSGQGGSGLADDEQALARVGAELDLGRLYDALQTGWQDCLWSDYYVAPLESDGIPAADVMLPGNLLREQERSIAGFRRDTLLGEFGARAATGWMRLPGEFRRRFETATIVKSVKPEGHLLLPTLGARGGPLRFPPRSFVSLGLVGEPYLLPLLDEPLPDFHGLTCRQLLDTWELISTLCEVLAARLPDPFEPPVERIADLQHWAPRVSKAGLERAVAEVLDVSDNEAQIAVGAFVLPMKARTNPWTRPLIAVGGDALVPLFNPIENPNLIRSIEAWLDEGGLPLSRRGELFEAALREELKGEVELPNAEITPRSLVVRAAGAAEEIDLVIRIGCTFLIGEVKCSVYPVGPFGFYSYDRTLEGAAEQARRKALFCEENPTAFLAAVESGCDPARAQFLPVVVSNLPLGVGRRIQGVPVTDLFILSRYLDGGQRFARNAVAGPKGIERRERVSFYSSPTEAERKVWAYLSDPPQIRDLRAWTKTMVGDMVPPRLMKRRLLRKEVRVDPPSQLLVPPIGAGIHGVAPTRAVAQPGSDTPKRRPMPSGERNAPCPCGSGKKRKRCCG